MDITKFTLKQIREMIHADSHSIKDGVVTLRWGFFYTMGKTTRMYEDRVKKVFPGATIVDSGEIWKPFRGGASLANQSHFYVKFKLEESNG